MGIDLGTTHTVVAYADTAASAKPAIQLFAIDQLIAPGEVAIRSLLPSLRYHPAQGEVSEATIRLPWKTHDPGQVPNVVLGELARELGTKVPGRLVASAKSWLSHGAVDRTAPILPWGGPEDVPKVSPLDASASYLRHVRDDWNWHYPQYPLEQQDVVITVPASFDEAARSLTVEAAQLAGFLRVRLLEEPLAACYDWLFRHRESLATLFQDIRLLLICDVGGGTTDLTLIQTTPTEGGLKLSRIGVGDHLMLGGDNMDLALAHHIERRLGGERLSAAGLSQLIQQCRLAKERLLAPDAPEHTTVTVLGTGAKLIGGARSAELSRGEVRTLVEDGFLPTVERNERLQRRRAGIVEFGLFYAADPAITRHVAAFLAYHAQASREALGDRAPAEGEVPVPDAVLLNGGVFQSAALARRLLGLLDSWRGAPLRQLDNADPNLAVARGAVAYGMAWRGQGVRIGGGSARSYFLVVEDEHKQRQGVCLLPRGMEEGQEVRLTERIFRLRLGEPVRFHLVSSTGDTFYRPGEVVGLDEEALTVLPPIATVLSAGEKTGEIPVQLVAMQTEVGTLEVRCEAVDDRTRHWQLAFQLRGMETTAVAATSHPRFAEAAEWLERFYGSRSKVVEPKEVKTLRAHLERVLGKRDDWDSALLRQLFDVLWQGVRRRRRSADHERVWLSLAGYCLRPGFGYPLDDWRVQQLWSVYPQEVQYGNETQIWSEWWTLWRRVAGGLEEAAQLRILDDIAAELKPASGKMQPKSKGVKGTRKASYDDMVRLVASLERLPAKRKIEVGRWLLSRLSGKEESPQTWWAMGRLGARAPLYGSAHNVVPRTLATEWLQQLLKLDWKKVQPAAFAATLLARCSGDRERDVVEDLRITVVQRLRTAKAPDSWVRMVEEVVELEEVDERRVFGEALPPGLKLIQ